MARRADLRASACDATRGRAVPIASAAVGSDGEHGLDARVAAEPASPGEGGGAVLGVALLGAAAAQHGEAHEAVQQRRRQRLRRVVTDERAAMRKHSAGNREAID